MGELDPAVRGAAGFEAFVVGTRRSDTALLYKLLCLHPDVAYVSNLESRLPWLSASATGRLRLRRYSSKLRCWFDVCNAPAGAGRSFVDRVAPVPAEAEALCGRRRANGGGGPDAMTMARMRSAFERLRHAAGAQVLVARLDMATRRLPLVDAVFPRACYLRVIDDDRGRSVESARISRFLARVPRHRVHSVRVETLVAEPIEQTRGVLEYLGLERRKDYEWALRTLPLGHPLTAGRSNGQRRWSDEALCEQDPVSGLPRLVSATPESAP